MNQETSTPTSPGLFSGIVKVVTHGGKAHEDETYAAAHALFKNPGAILERVMAPTEEDLEDPTVLVLDIGKRYEPEKNNYDHHQLAPDHNDLSQNQCALTLYLMHAYTPEGGDPMETHKELSEIFPWMESLSIKDTTGMKGLSSWLGVSKKQAVHGLICQPGNTFWTQFINKQDRYEPGTSEHDMLRMLGEHIDAGIKQMQDRLELLQNGGIDLISHEGSQIAVITLPHDQEPTVGVNIWISRYYRESRLKKKRVPSIELTVFITRTQSYAVYDSVSGNGRYNLLGLKDHPDVSFCHTSNFLAVFTHQDLGKVLEAITTHADKNRH
jgi:Uncharacterised protein family (UPF0160)